MAPLEECQQKIFTSHPLIRDKLSRHPKTLSLGRLHQIIHDLHTKASLITHKLLGRRYDLWTHSIRRFFRTQMVTLSVDRDCIECMMEFTISTYNDIKMKGIEFLRGIYMVSGLSIKQKTHISKIDALKEIIHSWEMDPDQILAKKALAQPHRIFISSPDKEQIEIQKLRYVLKESIMKEMQSADPKNGINSHLENGSPGEIRTLVRGSKALYACPLHHRASYPLYVQLS